MPVEKVCPVCGRTFKSPPSAKRIYCSRKCWKKDDRWKEHISKSRKGQRVISPERYKEIGEKRRKHHFTKKQLMKEYWEKGKTVAEIAKELGAGVGTVHRYLVKFGIPRRSKLVAKNRKPNGLEMLLIDVIKRRKLPYKYTGNGTYMIGKRKPDFIHTEGKKKVIELFGNYWHSPLVNPQVHPSATMKATVEAYRKEGYECLIIWEDELKNLDKLEKKIGDFG